MKQSDQRAYAQLGTAGLDRLDIRVETFDDEFITGMTRIFNETPVRQGRRFWHYGKDFDTVRSSLHEILIARPW